MKDEIRLNNDVRLVINYYHQDDNMPNCIYVHPERTVEIQAMDIKFSDVEATISHHLIDKLGFSAVSFQIKKTNVGKIKYYKSLIAEIKFVDDGIIMAKLHGILE